MQDEYSQSVDATAERDQGSRPTIPNDWYRHQIRQMLPATGRLSWFSVHDDGGPNQCVIYYEGAKATDNYYSGRDYFDLYVQALKIRDARLVELQAGDTARYHAEQPT